LVDDADHTNRDSRSRQTAEKDDGRSSARDATVRVVDAFA
jgi:hypothetical protein